MKAQRGKIILLCLCLIFAMLIISGKASKLGTYLYVRCNYTHLEEFAAEVIQTGAIPDDRYKRRCDTFLTEKVRRGAKRN
ncbi:hypothetical protein DXC62_10775, partial [Ruminococcaceae bacterium TF06-43]